MKSKKIFSVILSLSLMFSGMSFCFAEKNSEKTLLGPKDNIVKIFDADFRDLRDFILSDKGCGWSENKKGSTNCEKDGFNIITSNYSKNDREDFQLEANWTCKILNVAKTFNCSISDYNPKDKAGIFTFNGDNYLIVEDKLTSIHLANTINKLYGKASETKEELCADYIKRNSELTQENTALNMSLNNCKEAAKNNSSLFSWLSLPVVGAAVFVVWLGNLIYKNYKLITAKNNKKTQAQQSKYYYDSNSGIYYIIDEQGAFQPVYQGSTPVMMPQEKKEEKISNPEVTEKKEDAPKTEEKSSKVEQDKILKDIVEDALN